MSERINRLRERLPAGFEAALITDRSDLFYFLDFDAGDAGTLLILRDSSYYFIDSRYIEIAQSTVKTARVIEEHLLLEQIARCLRDASVSHLMAESSVSVKYAGILKNALNGIDVDFSECLAATVSDMRTVKDAEEKGRMIKAQQITDSCFDFICGKIRPGSREIDLALEMECYMRSHGASDIAFPVIFASGEHSSMPHAVPGERIVRTGDFITMDFGAKYAGYCADMTRTVAVGQVTAEMKKVYGIVLEAQMACCASIRAGLTGKQADRISRDIIEAAGYGDYFGHGTGHSVGIDIHEKPYSSRRDDTILMPGISMTVEPGIYLPGKFGVRIEDMVFLTESGCEIPGKCRKDLVIL